jgi:hypothetical protein
MKEFLTFRKYVTPMAIQILFWVGVAVTTIYGITLAASSHGVAYLIVRGLMWLFIGPIVVRVLCELVTVQFKLLERLEELRGRFGQGG